MSAPAISIVLPTFNGSRYLEESVESCLKQTFADWELIIVDDCSTDATPNIIERLCRQDSRVRSVRHQQNRKLPAALNSGFDVARGEFFTWTSDDNRYHAEALQVMLDALRRDESAAGVYTPYRLIDDEGAPQGLVAVPEPEFVVLENAMGPSFLYRRAVAEAVGPYDEGLFLVEDYDFWLRLCASFRMVRLDACVYSYRRHEGSLTATRVSEINARHGEAQLRHLPRTRGFSRRNRAAGLLHAASLLLQEGQRPLALKALGKALQTAPLLALWYTAAVRISDRSALVKLVRTEDGPPQSGPRPPVGSVDQSRLSR